MERLFEQFVAILQHTDQRFERYLMAQINWNRRLVGIRGARGVGKTTLLLQRIKKLFPIPTAEVLYVSLDNVYFHDNTLADLADRFYKRGGKYLFLDEVHKYARWSAEIKHLYDSYPDLTVVFTGSSMIELQKGEADLSRRAVMYSLFGLSFREYLVLETQTPFSPLTLDDLLHHHTQRAQEVTARIRPLQYFDDYLRFGYYPFYLEGKDEYLIQLQAVLNLIIETDLPSATNIVFATTTKLKRLLGIIAEATPFKPNISKLSTQINVTRDTLITYLFWLEKAGLINLLRSATHGVSALGKPDKIYLNNSNLMYALTEDTPNIGNLRETFFYNQLLGAGYAVQSAQPSDFLAQGHTFEVGGKNKKRKQIQDVSDSFIIADDIEIGLGQKIPLWMAGMLY